jgi:hypothetical protein
MNFHIKFFTPPFGDLFFYRVAGNQNKISSKNMSGNIPGHLTCPEDYYLVKKRMGEYLKD